MWLFDEYEGTFDAVWSVIEDSTGFSWAVWAIYFPEGTTDRQIAKALNVEKIPKRFELPINIHNRKESVKKGSRRDKNRDGKIKGYSRYDKA